ncbi:MAG: hypothetical protein AAF914_10870 [Pseudomonadota bacterium]
MGDVMIFADNGTLAPVETLRAMIERAAEDDGLLLVPFWDQGNHGVFCIDASDQSAGN